MNKIDLNKRTIRFYSEKEKQILTVFNEPAYIYAMNLETDDMISNYKIAVELNKSQFIHIDTVGLRNEMFNQNWYSDFTSAPGIYSHATASGFLLLASASSSCRLTLEMGVASTSEVPEGSSMGSRSF